MAVTDLGSYTLGGINIGLAAGIGLLNPMLLQFDLFLTGQFGLGSYMIDIQAQFNAAISAVLALNLVLIDPLQAIRALIAALASLQAALSVALSFGLPTSGLQISAQIGAMTALQASLGIKVAGLKGLLAGGAAVKIPMLQYVSRITGALAAGPAHLVSFTGATLGVSGQQLAIAFAGGLGPDDPIHPTDLVDGILIVTKDPAVFSALAAILKTS